MSPEQKEKLLGLLASFIKGRWFLAIAIVAFGAISNYFNFPSSDLPLEVFLYLAFFVVLYNAIIVVILKKEFVSNKLAKFLGIVSLACDVLAVTILVYITGKGDSPLFVFYILPIIEAALISKVIGFILSLGSILMLYNVISFLETFNSETSLSTNIIKILVNNLIILLCAFFAEFILLYIGAQEDRLLLERDKVRSLLKNLTAGLILIDNKGKISFTNPQAEKMLEFKQSDVLGLDINSKDLEKFVHFKKIIDTFKEVDTSKETYINIQLQNAANSYLKISPVFIEDEHNHYVGVMYVLEDLSREKLLSDMKSEFISLAAHQLRTPLSAIKWLLRMFLTGDFGELTLQQKEYIKKGYETNEKLVELVRDLLDVSRIEEGRYGFNFKKVNIKNLVEKIVPMYIFKSQEKDIHFTFNEPSFPIADIVLDEEKISIVLQNLLDNAFKYTPKSGDVTLSLIPKEQEVQFVISDTGMGILEEEKQKIFSKFFRGYNALRSNIEGTGLGLFIVKNIIEKHKGKIWFESQVGKGTTFYFTIPYNIDA